MTIAHMDQSPKAVILPFYGEFGWLVMSHIRYVHAHPASEKIVCCERGMECLYPSATAFFYDFKNPQPDTQRMGHTGYGWQACNEHDQELRLRLVRAYPDHTTVRPQYDCPWHMSDAVKLRPQVAHQLPRVDVCLGVRRRAFVPEKNWQHWPQTARALRTAGLRVGLVGDRDTSFSDLPTDAYAWNHPDGSTAGTVDLLNHCRFYLGTDTGVSHLAALMDVPALIFRKSWPGNHDLTGVMARSNKTFHRRLADGSWENPDEVLGAALRCLDESSYYSQHGEDRWITDNLALPEAGTFVEVGAGDGRSCSNSLAFELRGWQGVIVEADPRRDLSWRKCRVERCAVTDYDGEVEFGQEGHLDHSGIGRGGKKITVPCKRLDTILAEAEIGAIDLLSIDTEGTELDVWRGLSKHRPKVVIIEWDTAGLPQRAAEIEQAMTESGYMVLKKIGGNFICVPKPL